MPRHKHADLMIAYAADSSLVIECCNPKLGSDWVTVADPTFSVGCEYRIKPKPVVKVPMWQWVYRNSDGCSLLTNGFYASEADVRDALRGKKLLARAEWTRIEVEA